MDYKALATELFEYIVKSRKPALEERGHFSRGEMGILICLNFNKDGVTSEVLERILVRQYGTSSNGTEEP